MCIVAFCFNYTSGFNCWTVRDFWKNNRTQEWRSGTEIKMDINHGIMNIGNEQLPKNEDIEPQQDIEKKKQWRKVKNKWSQRTKTLTQHTAGSLPSPHRHVIVTVVIWVAGKFHYQPIFSTASHFDPTQPMMRFGYQQWLSLHWTGLVRNEFKTTALLLKMWKPAVCIIL